VFVDGIECVTLAHGQARNAVLAHPFYGTAMVVAYIDFLAARAPVDSDVVVDDAASLQIFHSGNLRSPLQISC
jgi:type IV secretory pathway TrbL component